MEIQLQELIDQIKKDGVAAAETEAESILQAAKAEAETILSNARAEADQIVLRAKTEQERLVKSGEDAIRQAGRNLLLSFRESVVRELTAVVRDNVEAVNSSETFAQLILRAVEGWAALPDAGDLTVLLNSADLARLEKTLLADLKARVQNGVTLKASDHFDGGFRIAMQDDGVYYDFSAEAVVEMLSNYLSPNITALLKEAE